MKRKSDDKREADTTSKSHAHQSKPRKTVPKKIPKKNKQDDLKAAEERLRLFSEAVEEGLVIHDKGILIEVNQACARMFGYESSEMIGMNAKELATPESWKKIKKYISTGYRKPYEGTGVRKDGSTFACSLVGKPYKYKGRTLRVATFNDITERKRMENALRASEEKYCALVENSTDGVSIIQDKKIKFSNKRLAEMSGYTVEELTGMSIYNLVPSDFSAELKDRLKHRLSRRKKIGPVPTTFNTRLLCKDGTIKAMENVFKIIRYEGKPAIIAASRDVTERKIGEEKIRASEEMFASAFKHSPNGMCISTVREGRYVDANDLYISTLGYQREEIIGFTSFDINLWVDTVERDAMVRELIQTGKVTDFELHFRDKKGNIHLGLTSASLIKIGEESYILTQTQDITERKKMEQNLEKSEAQYHLLADHTKDQIWLMDLNLNITYISPSVKKISGYPPEEIIKMPLDKILTEASLKLVLETFSIEISKASENPPPPSYAISLELEVYHKDGHIFPFEATLSFIQDKNGNPLYILGEGRDITERKKAEEKLRREEQMFRSFAEQSSDIIVLADTRGAVLYENPAMEKILGYKVEERIGSSGFELIHPDDMKIVTDAADILFNDTNAPVIKNELRLRHKDGSWRIFDGAASNLVHDNVVEAVVINMHDITKRKNTEDNLIMTQFAMDRASYNILWLDDSAKIIYANDASLASLAYTREELLTMTIHDIDPDFPADAWLAHVDELKKHRFLTFESSHRKKNGAFFPVEATCNYFEYKGRFYCLAFDRDITARKQTEGLMRQSEEKYRTILDNMQEGYWETDIKGNYTFLNDVICRQLGYSREELMRINSLNFSDKEYSKILFHICRRIYETGEPSRDFHWQIIRKDGTKRDIEGSIFLLKNSSGKPKGFRGIAHDITERKKGEEAIRQSEEKYRLLADHTKDYVWLMDLNLKISYISPSVEKLMGYTPDDFKTLPLNNLLTAASFETAMDFFSHEMPKALNASPDYVLERSLELEFCCRDGRTVWGECNFSLIRDEIGNPVQILGVSRNINERKQMEDALKRSEENFRVSLDESPLGVRISSIEGKTLYANRAILDIYGYDNVEELINTPLKERYTPESYAEYQIRKSKRLKGETGPSEYEISIVRKDGEIRHLHVFRKEIFWNGNKQSQVIYQDVTLRRQAEEKLSQTLENLRQSVKITIQVLGTASEAKDPYMAGHQKRVADLARAIATEMKLPHDKIEAIRMAGAIHDIGKISVPSEILCKPAILSDLEFSFVKNHPRYSYDIIKEVESPWPLADIVHQHHERIDGSGYPLGLKGTDILIESRILAVADVVEAMVSYRPYRPALGIEIALAEIENNAGILYDCRVVETCIRLFREKGYQMA